MLKDHKDEMIVMLKRKNADLEEQIKQLSKANDDMKKGDTAAEAKIKALNEMHSQKIKTLLKSINNLKKEVQKEKFEKKDNVRAQKIERLMKDIELQEVAINALKRLVNDEDKCFAAIKQDLEKGPKRIRVASREELKMDIAKYKNMTLRLLEVLKQNGIKQPAGIKVDAEAGTGLKQDKTAGAFDINNMSRPQSENGDPNNGEGDLGLNDEELLAEKERLEENLVKVNMELKDKNEKLLELLDEIEEIKIQVYSRDKTIELQQKQIEDLLEELRDCKSVDHDIKILVSKKIAIEEENQRLKKELDEKFMTHHEKQFESNELTLENKSLVDQIKALQKQLETERVTAQQARSKLEAEKVQLTKDLQASKTEFDTLKKQTALSMKQSEEMMQRLSLIDGQANGALQKKNEDLDAYRRQVVEIEKQLKLKEDQIAQLESKIVLLSTDLADKEYEIEFFSTQIEELKSENELLKASGAKPQSAGQNQTGGAASGEVVKELEALKKKYRLLQLREVELQEEVDRLKAQQADEMRRRTIGNVIEKQRSKSRGRTMEGGGTLNDRVNE